VIRFLIILIFPIYCVSQEVEYTEVRPIAIPTFFDTSFYIGSKFIRVDNNSMFYKLPKEDGSKNERDFQAFVEKMTDTITGITRERFFGIDTILLEEYSFSNYKDQHLNIGKHVKLDSNGTVILIVDYDNDTIYTPQNIMFSKIFNDKKREADSLVLNNVGEIVFNDCKLDLWYSLINSGLFDVIRFTPNFEANPIYHFYYDLVLKDGFRLKFIAFQSDSLEKNTFFGNSTIMKPVRLSMDDIQSILKSHGLKYNIFSWTGYYRLLTNNDSFVLEFTNEIKEKQINNSSLYKVKVQTSQINLHTGEFSKISVVDKEMIIIKD
jgi:hypothetical protein